MCLFGINLEQNYSANNSDSGNDINSDTQIGTADIDTIGQANTPKMASDSVSQSNTESIDNPESNTESSEIPISTRNNILLRFENQARVLDTANDNLATRSDLHANAVVMRELMQDMITITGEVSPNSENNEIPEIDEAIDNPESKINTDNTSDVPSGSLDSCDQTLAQVNDNTDRVI